MTKGQAGSKVQDSRIPGFQDSRVQVPISKVPRSRAPRFDRGSRSVKFQSSRVPGEPRFQKCKVSKFQGSRVPGSVFKVQGSKIPGFQGSWSRLLSRFQASKGSKVPKVPGFQGSRSFQSPEVSKFQGSRVRVPRFQGFRVAGFQGYTRRSSVVWKYDLFKALSKQ